jgi:titin
VINRFTLCGILSQQASPGHTIAGNYIGTDASGNTAAGNGIGICIWGESTDNTIGGTTESARNVISGNDHTGVQIRGFDATGNTILGNYIGTDVSGTMALGNRSIGVRLHGASGSTIGGLNPAARNLISGNGVTGVVPSAGIMLSDATGNSIVGNYIGTDVTGNVALRNSTDGIFLTLGASNNTIGGTEEGAQNVISGNGGDWGGAGIRIMSWMTPAEDTSGNTILGNYIGTDATGTAALGNVSQGIVIDDASNNIVGGAAAGAGNVISASGVGVWIGEWDGVNGNLVLGNLIGTDVTGTENLGNQDGGVLVFGARNTIGGTSDGEANTIAFNGRFGVMIHGSSTYPNSLTQNTILGNSIFSNDGLGIDLTLDDDPAVGPDGPTPNDPVDPDFGPNLLQNFPELSDAVLEFGRIRVDGTLTSLPNTTFRLHYYANTEMDPSGYGEGEIYLGETTVYTGGAGTALFSANINVAPPPGSFITATATDPDGNTSEFSAAVELVQGSATVPGLGGVGLVVLTVLLT